MDYRTTALYAGVGTVAFTHLWISAMPGPVDEVSKKYHSWANLAAVGAIVYGARIIG